MWQTALHNCERTAGGTANTQKWEGEKKSSTWVWLLCHHSQVKEVAGQPEHCSRKSDKRSTGRKQCL